MIEHRGSTRVRTWKPAHIVLDGGCVLMRCSITDISDTGIAVKLDGSSAVPKSFDLLFEREVVRGPGSAAGATSRMVVEPCDLVWRKGDQLGVRFSRAQAGTMTPGLVAARTHRAA